MQNNIILNKCEIIKRCLRSIRNNYSQSKDIFLTSCIHQDAAILNLERAAQAAMDLAAHVVRKKYLGVPQKSAELFSLLEEHKIISHVIAEKMRHMVGFRNTAVHEYQELDMDIVVSVIENNLTDFEMFMKEILAAK